MQEQRAIYFGPQIWIESIKQQQLKTIEARTSKTNTQESKNVICHWMPLYSLGFCCFVTREKQKSKISCWSCSLFCYPHFDLVRVFSAVASWAWRNTSLVATLWKRHGKKLQFINGGNKTTSAFFATSVLLWGKQANTSFQSSVFCTITVYPISKILKSSLEVQNTKTTWDLLHKTFWIFL